ncbi:hypothetical protein [Streptomyces sp. NPDC060001]|uniref:hypothetical protein n=1 Tax=Streptomyces sp. NPDC060001 TaxID=3347032 RepID=UPI00369A76B5
MDDIHHCSRCDRERPADAFAYCAYRGLQPWCRDCKTEHQRERRRVLREDRA